MLSSINEWNDIKLIGINEKNRYNQITLNNLSYNDILKLNENTWLNDSVLNKYMELLNQEQDSCIRADQDSRIRANDIYFCNTFAYIQIEKGKDFMFGNH